MATYSELTSIDYEGVRFCLDRVSKEDGTFPYALVWRGTSVSPDGFINAPAFFTFDQLGILIRKARAENVITESELSALFINLIGLNQ
jgi:hypothetical protein